MDSNKFTTLDKIPLNNVCYVYKINTSGSKNIKRMLDLGIVKNALLIPIHNSMFKSTTAYLIHGSVIALRQCDAENIIVTYSFPEALC